MRKNWMQLMAAFLMGIMMPILAIQLGQTVASAGQEKQWQTEPTSTDQLQITLPQGQTDLQIPVLLEEYTVRRMGLDEYLLGVVLAEMPADFDFEALKAQAVAARTCALQCTREGNKHPSGAVCTDSKCCQAYIEPEMYLADGGTQEAVEIIWQSITETHNEVLTYQGALIQATYFSCSGGQTEDAAAVWGEQMPYLVSVSSPGEENAPMYTATVTFTAAEFAACLGRELIGTCQQWLGQATYTRGGSVAAMAVAGKSYTGTELRQLLSLNSAAFTMEADENSVTVVTSGKGHRVGMSQYGADAMAREGCTYEQILMYYYRGTRIDKVDTLG